MWASRCGHRKIIGGAPRADLCGHGFDQRPCDEEHDERDDHERDQRGDEDAVVDRRRAGILRGLERWIALAREVDEQVLEIDLAERQATGGMMMSFTRLFTTVASASPRMNASASASALDLTRNARNSDHIDRTPSDAAKRGVLGQSPCQPCERTAERYNLDVARRALLGS